MPEYLAPGVYVEEVSFRSKSIEGVSTTTTGFVGPTRYGPVEGVPDLITSLGEFERIYGDGQPHVWNGRPYTNFVWQAARAFFEEGGKRLYVARVFSAGNGSGRASAQVPKSAAAGEAIQIQARFPGRMSAMRVQLTFNLGQNVLSTVGNSTTLGGLQPGDVVWISDVGSPIEVGASVLSIGDVGAFFVARRTAPGDWYFVDNGETKIMELGHLRPDTGDRMHIVTVTLTILPTDPFDLPRVWSDLPLDPDHERAGSTFKDSLFSVFAERPANLSEASRLPLVVTRGSDLRNGAAVLAALLSGAPDQVALQQALLRTGALVDKRTYPIELTGGNDGVRPDATAYEGIEEQSARHKSGLKALKDLDDISIVAAPGSTYGLDDEYPDGRTIMSHLIAHASEMRYRIAVLDSGNNQTIAQVRRLRGTLDSKYAALYFPWVRVLDPITREERHLPPSGFVSGIYARNDITRAVFKAPANEVVNLAIGFEAHINKSQQDVLNPEGINCFRFFEGRGYRLWGARTITSDPEWKYVNLRRYFAYLEHSIDRGTQWAVFEPNGEALWANVRRTVEDFLFNEWQSGALLGDKPEKAFFVRCDRTTMTQNDLDNGRLVCLLGVVALRPAEFVIFRIGQATADAMRRAS
jgi:phage tail sheath protein FI